MKNILFHFSTRYNIGMKQERFFGILLPIFSLPSTHGIGTLGKAAYDFVDFLAASGAKVWQMLPLNITSYGDSPYQSPSSKGFNPYFIDLDLLCEQGLLKPEEIPDDLFFSNPHYIQYSSLFNHRYDVLRKAFNRFDRKTPDFVLFEQKGEYHDFALFMTLKAENHFRAWKEWPEEEQRDSEALEQRILKEHKDDYEFYLWTQYEFIKQYRALKQYANQKGVRIMGDMPIYVAYDSVDVWKYPELFALDENHNPKMVAGVPPDAFSADGQLWGNPIYDWHYQKETGYQWFNQRIYDNLAIFDILRIDHFRGFSAFYEIPYGDDTARNGHWEDGPKFDLFKDKTELPIIAENLGVIDQGVIDLLNETNYPGMAVVAFGITNLAEDDSNKPWNSVVNEICYTGTHDNEPVYGMLKNLTPEEKPIYLEATKRCAEYCHIENKSDSLDDWTDTILRLAFAYPCFGTVIPMVDLLHLGDEARTNFPSKVDGKNWIYRFSAEDFSSNLSEKIRSWVKEFKR